MPQRTTWSTSERGGVRKREVDFVVLAKVEYEGERRSMAWSWKSERRSMA